MIRCGIKKPPVADSKKAAPQAATGGVKLMRNEIDDLPVKILGKVVEMRRKL